MITIDKIFGWVFTTLGVGALVGVVGYGAYWHWFTVGVCALMAWGCFREAHEEATKKA